MIKEIEEAMLAHVRRALHAHVKKHGSFVVDCVNRDKMTGINRTFTALDKEHAEQFGIEIIGVKQVDILTYLLIQPIDRVRHDIPRPIRHGHWWLEMKSTDVIGAILFRKDEPLLGFMKISCDAIDDHVSSEHLMAMKRVIDVMIKNAQQKSLV